MLSHELRNPLAPLRTGLELIRLAGNTPASVERVRIMMERQVGYMVRLVDDLLDVSRIASGKIHLHREPTLLTSVITSAVDANRQAMLAKQQRVEVDLPETDVVVDVDPTRFVQVLSNLLHNATKFTEPGGSIRVSARINESDPNRTSTVSISVQDTGIGIPGALLPHVFDLFTQGPGPSSEPGLGIGLALARRLIEMQGGQIVAKSEGTGRGSEFVVQMPLSRESVHASTAETVPPAVVDCRVVVVDDNRDAALVMAMLVEELGGECRATCDGPSGLAEVLNYRPDVVLLDISMPGMDGYEICRRIRRDVGHSVLIVAVTGLGQEEDKDRARRAGFDAHLTKPADPAALARILFRSGSSRTTEESGFGQQPL
jgi:CheY-like chemotaxis protein